jgi:hypothetical protein
MITKEQAMTVNNFTHATLKNKDNTPCRVRRSGKTQTWKTRPDEFKIPVKYGLYQSLYITQNNAHEFNVAD